MSSAFALLSDPIGNKNAPEEWQKPKKRRKRKQTAPSVTATEIADSDHRDTKPSDEVRFWNASLHITVFVVNK